MKRGPRGCSYERQSVTHAALACLACLSCCGATSRTMVAFLAMRRGAWSSPLPAMRLYHSRGNS